MRTAAGYIFTCKTCDIPHLLVVGEPHDGIRVPCYTQDDTIETYKKKDFTFWHGFLDAYTSCMVQEAKD